MMKNQIIPLSRCKEIMAAAGWKFSHRSIVQTYIFVNPNCGWAKELAFNLSELRHAARFGF